MTRRRRISSDWTSGMPALSSVASSWLKTRNSRVAILRRCGSLSEPRPRAPARWIGEDVEALLLELAAEPRLAVGDVDAFDDVAARGAEPAAKFHPFTGAGRRCPAQNIVSMDIIGGTTRELYISRPPAGPLASGRKSRACQWLDSDSGGTADIKKGPSADGPSFFTSITNPGPRSGAGGFSAATC